VMTQLDYEEFFVVGHDRGVHLPLSIYSMMKLIWARK